MIDSVEKILDGEEGWNFFSIFGGNFAPLIPLNPY